MSISHINQDDTLYRFRSELVAEGYLHDGDSIGTDDETLLYVQSGFVCSRTSAMAD